MGTSAPLFILFLSGGHPGDGDHQESQTAFPMRILSPCLRERIGRPLKITAAAAAKDMQNPDHTIPPSASEGRCHPVNSTLVA